MSGVEPKDPAAVWTPERLSALSKTDVENLRANAIRRGAEALVERCDEELIRRTPRKQQRPQEQAAHASEDVVLGYHFVCAGDRGVAQLENGRFRSGSWVVAEANVRRSLEYGAYLALHQTKAEPSYRQGRILDYARTPREMVEGELEEGIEFLVEATDEPYAWIGAGTGEKGYLWLATKAGGRVVDLMEGDGP